MPLLPPAMQSLIQTKASLNLMAGSKLPHVVSAIATATCQYLMAFSIVNSTNMVLGPGAGTQVGIITGLTPDGMSKMILTKAYSQGLSGKDLISLCSAVSFGVVTSLYGVIIQGSVIGGGPGTGTGFITGLAPNVLQGNILSQEAFKLMGGSKIPTIVSAIALGICTYLMASSIVNITNIGAAAPPPVGPIPIPAAPGIGRFS